MPYCISLCYSTSVALASVLDCLPLDNPIADITDLKGMAFVGQVTEDIYNYDNIIDFFM